MAAEAYYSESEGGKDAEIEHLTRLSKLYLAIVFRYRDYIEEHESISVAELPTLIKPKNEKIVQKAQEIKSNFENYNYDEDFHEAAMIAFEFVKDEIDEVSLPIQFWINPEETLGLMAGDAIDKNILLCSLLIALGNPTAKVFMNFKEESKKILVYFKFAEKIHVLDLDDGSKVFNSEDELNAFLNLGDDSTAYEFNDHMYVDLK
ncbi:hypothetical protein M1452_00605 [Candidatus Marsarchaeota archaeon]|jgi:hypothetical protein|nr:hypothetical protein [Candidatus Marsarchaeota archaeon]